MIRLKTDRTELNTAETTEFDNVVDNDEMLFKRNARSPDSNCLKKADGRESMRSQRADSPTSLDLPFTRMTATPRVNDTPTFVRAATIITWTTITCPWRSPMGIRSLKMVFVTKGVNMGMIPATRLAISMIRKSSAQHFFIANFSQSVRLADLAESST